METLNLEEFKPNSFKSKETKSEPVPEKKVKKVVSGTVKTKKKSGLVKIADTFIEDDVNNVKSYVVGDVIIPTIKKTLYDVITGSLSMALFGETGRSGARSITDKVSYRNYTSYSNKQDTRPTRRTSPGYSYDEIVIENRGEAESVLNAMDDMMATYGIVSVADFYDLVGVTCSYTDNKYGWTNIRNAQIVRVRDGYIIKMPKAMPLD